MTAEIEPTELKRCLDERGGLALVDVREHGEYNPAHIPGASSLPRRLLEFRFERLIPCRGVQVVLCDDDGRRAALAARTVERMGYTRVASLAGGLNRWASAGLPTEWGMNVPSKDFGERVEVEHHVPTIEATDLQRRRQAGEQLIILDTRTPEEYGQYCIPGGRSLPGGELALRIGEIARREPASTIVVNCAGRTRGIIGARLLQRMGVPAVSLKNGTSGWVLAGLQLEQGARRLELPEPDETSRAAAEEFARRVCGEDGVKVVVLSEFEDMLANNDSECVYLVDVRTEQEYAAGHIPGFAWFPGGQAVQRADDLVAVRDARIVFCCDGRVRSTVTASWFRQLGFENVYALDGGVQAWLASGRQLEAGRQSTEPFGLAEAAAGTTWLSPAELHALTDGAVRPSVVFLDTSREFAAGHVPGARWLSRSWLELRIESLVPNRGQPIVLTDADGRGAALAAVRLAELDYREVAALEGGMGAWRQAGLPLEQGLAGVMAPPDDVVPVGPERSYADMMHYLRWEEALGRKYEQ